MLDLKTKTGLETSHRLVATCDIFVETIRPGVVARLTLGAEALDGCIAG